MVVSSPSLFVASARNRFHQLTLAGVCSHQLLHQPRRWCTFHPLPLILLSTPGAPQNRAYRVEGVYLHARPPWCSACSSCADLFYFGPRVWRRHQAVELWYCHRPSRCFRCPHSCICNSRMVSGRPGASCGPPHEAEDHCGLRRICFYVCDAA